MSKTFLRNCLEFLEISRKFLEMSRIKVYIYIYIYIYTYVKYYIGWLRLGVWVYLYGCMLRRLLHSILYILYIRPPGCDPGSIRPPGGYAMDVRYPAIEGIRGRLVGDACSRARC